MTRDERIGPARNRIEEAPRTRLAATSRSTRRNLDAAALALLDVLRVTGVDVAAGRLR